MKQYKTHITDKFIEDGVEYFSVIVDIDGNKFGNKLPLSEYDNKYMLLLDGAMRRLRLYKNPILIGDGMYKSDGLYTNEENEEMYNKGEIRGYIKQ